jgi:hypothetical protein
VELRLKGTPARRRLVNRVAAIVLPLSYLVAVIFAVLL